MSVLVFDPSGNFKEGNGTTGWALFKNRELKDFGEVKASHFSEAEEYWHEVAQLITDYKPEVMVYETYRLRASKAMEQSWSRLETPQLIGVIRWHAWSRGIKVCGQDPSLKERFRDDILISTGVAEKRPGGIFIHQRRTNMHMRDAIRHGLYYHRFGEGRI